MSESDDQTSDNNVNAAAEVSQMILETVYNLYTEDTTGDGINLTDLAKKYGVHVTPPKRKVWVVLIGNHSAGKSSFINWYVEEPVQKTSVAIETAGFTIITNGKKRETFSGPATAQLYPFLKTLAELKGVVAALTTEIVPSDARSFPLLTFVDTPGLVDGEMKYPFEPEEAMILLAKHADLIFNFFDPIGQALCARTMRIVEKLCEENGHKMHFFLSKADTVPDETDRQRVLVQIAQNLTYRIKDQQFSLNIPPIYIPKENIPVRNHMNEVLAVIEKTIALGVQKSLQSLENDCKSITRQIEKRRKDDNDARTFNKRDCGRGFLLLSLTIGPLIFISLFIAIKLNLFGNSHGNELITMFEQSTSDLTVVALRNTGLLPFASFALWWMFVKKRKTLAVTERRVLDNHLQLLSEQLPRRHKELYKLYFEAHFEK